MSPVQFWPEAPFAGIAHLAERHLAKVEVASSNLVARSKSSPESSLDGSGVFFISRQIVYLKTKRRTGKCKQKRAAAGRRVSADDTKVPLVVLPQNVQKPFRGRGRAFSSLSLYLSLGAVSPLPKMRSSISGPMSTPPCIYEPVYACRGEKFREISNRDPHQRESHETL